MVMLPSKQLWLSFFSFSTRCLEDIWKRKITNNPLEEKTAQETATSELQYLPMWGQLGFLAWI